MRDLVETQTLVDYFSHEPSAIAPWRRADEKTRKQMFSHGRLRNLLDNRDGFKSRKRAADYAMFCAYGTHITYQGLGLIAGPTGLVTPGPLYHERQLINALVELARRVAYCTMTIVETLPDASSDKQELARTESLKEEIMVKWSALFGQLPKPASSN